MTIDSFGNKLKEARKTKNLTQKELAEKIGAKHNSVSNWENDQNRPDPDTIEMICGVLSITPNYLLKNSPSNITPHDYSLIQKYRILDEHGKGAVDLILNYEHARCTTTPKTDIKTEQFTVYPARDVIQFQLSEYKASAGRGTYLGPEAFTTIMVESNTLTKRALFGVPVSGDSMEPTYNDGDILIVERADSLEVGEIGVFTLDGEGYVKECGKGELISLNSKYEPIPMNEEIVLNGRVIGILDRAWIVE